MFADIAEELTRRGFETLILNQDSIHRERSRRILEGHGLSTRGLEEYDTFDIGQILDEEFPRVLALGHAGGLVERAFIRRARQRNIPTLLLQDGIIGEPSSLSARDSIKFVHHMLSYHVREPRSLLRYLYAFRSLGLLPSLYATLEGVRTSHGYAAEHCDKVAVMGEFAEEVFRTLGFRASQIVVTGQPRFDGLVSPQDAGKVHQDLATDPGARLIVAATPVFKSARERREFVAALMKACRDLENAVLVFKIHPREDLNPYMAQLRPFPGESRVLGDYPIPVLLRACSVLVSHYSTLTLEALIAGKPAVVLTSEDEPPYYPFGKEGAALEVSNATELRAALRRLLNDPGLRDTMRERSREFVHRHAHKCDGLAYRRVADLIGAMASSHNSARSRSTKR